VNHRRELKVLAQAGFVLSLIRLIASSFNPDWPARSTIWLLLLFGAFALFYCAKKASNPAVTDNRDWMKVPTRIRRALEIGFQVLGVLVFVLAFPNLRNLRSHPVSVLAHFISRVTPEVMTTFMYALAALFFAYGELQPPASETPSRDEAATPIPPPGIS
jgi:preprotein translocase subunit SecG